MDDLWEEVEAEKELIENTLAELTKALQSGDRSYVVLAGMAAFVHNLYNGIENIIFVHAYGILLDAEKLIPLANNATTIWHSFYTEIVAAYQTLKH